MLMNFSLRLIAAENFMARRYYSFLLDTIASRENRGTTQIIQDSQKGRRMGWRAVFKVEKNVTRLYENL